MKKYELQPDMDAKKYTSFLYNVYIILLLLSVRFFKNL